MTSLTLFSPSGVLAQAAPLKLAAKRLTALGFEVHTDEAALKKQQRFAGSDEERLAAIHRVADAAPSVALATRGGYGLSRLLDRLDWDRLATSVAKGTRWVGHSDLTTLHLGLMAHVPALFKPGRTKGAAKAKPAPADVDHAHHACEDCGHDHDHDHGDAHHGHDHGGHKHAGHGHTHGPQPGLWAGPLACGDFGRADDAGGVDEVTRDCFVEAMDGSLEGLGFRTEAGFDELQCRGRLWGGNLTMLCALLGTPHWPAKALTRGGVLFLEDVNEHPYRIERQLLQLHQAGVLDQQSAVLLGAFTDYRKSPLDRGYTLKTAVALLRSLTRTPVLTGLPFGHVPTKVCLPVGTAVQLVVQGRDALMAW